MASKEQQIYDPRQRCQVKNRSIEANCDIREMSKCFHKQYRDDTCDGPCRRAGRSLTVQRSVVQFVDVVKPDPTVRVVFFFHYLSPAAEQVIE